MLCRAHLEPCPIQGSTLSYPNPIDGNKSCVWKNIIKVLASEVGVVYTALDPKPGLLKVVIRASGFSPPFGMRAQSPTTNASVSLSRQGLE